MEERIIRVTAGSRLHFGMLSFGRPGERQFGGAGAMIATPALALSIGESEQLEIVGPLADRAEQFVTRLSHNAPWWRPRPCFRITIESAPPPHAGLGSGTQLGMALARGLATFFHAESQSAELLARAVGRGKRSAVGIHGATLGGLIIESGKLADEEISPLVCRVALPDQWRFVVVLHDETAGLSGEAEQRAFDRLPAMSLETSAALCRLLMCDLTPAASQGDFARFSESLYQYGRLAGQCFAAQQGGVYANPAVERLVERCLELGVRGVGQSSWGPTVFALCPTQNEAEDLVNLLRAASLTDAKMFVAAPDNHGIQVVAGGRA